MTDVAPVTERKPGQRYDWPAMKRDYIEGQTDDNGETHWPTIQQVAETHGALPQRLRDRAGPSQEGWTTERAAYQRRLEAEHQTERTRVLAKEGAELDSAALRIARTGLGVIGQRMNELGQLAANQARTNEGQTQDELATPAADSDEIVALGKSAHTFHRLGREAIGDIPEATLHVGVEGGIDVHQRTHRTELILVALADAGVLPGGMAVPLGGQPAGELDPPDDTTDEQVHSE